MAINQQVLIPRNESALDKLIKGLQVAQGFYGIKTAMEQSDLRSLQIQQAKQQEEQNKIGLQLSQMDLDSKSRKAELEKAGIIPQNDFNKNYFKVDENKINSLLKKYDYPFQPILLKVEEPNKKEGFDTILSIEKDDLKNAQKALIDAKKLDFAKETLKNKNQPKPTASAFASSGFAKRMDAANKVLDELETIGYNRAEASNALESGLTNVFGEIGEYFKTEELKLYDQAKQNFILAQLRDESGAAIGTDEYKQAEKIYFPQAGDTQKVIDQKRQARKIALQNQLAEAQYGFTGNINYQNNTTSVPDQENPLDFLIRYTSE